MIVVPYYPLADDVMHGIVRLKLSKVERRLHVNHGMRFEWSDDVVDQIAARCTEVASGARNIDHIITGTLLPDISRELLGRMAEGTVPNVLTVSLGTSGDFGYQFS
jgi:type VI secretion system protein VasG